MVVGSFYPYYHTEMRYLLVDLRERERVGSVCGGLDSGGLGIMSFWQSASRDSEGGGVVFLYISNQINEFFCFFFVG